MTAKNLQRKIGPGRLSAEETAQLPDRLLDAAFKLFMQKGYASTSMEQIAKEAGASTKTIYSRFPSKAEILRTVVRRMVERTIAAHAQTSSLDPRNADPRTYLLGLCGAIAMRIATDAAGLNRLAHLEGEQFPEFKQMHDEATANGARLIREALECWIEARTFPAVEDIQSVAALCLSMTTDWVRIATSLGHPPNSAEVREHVAFAVDFFLRGCGYQEAPPALAPKARRRAAKG
ncbi:MAG TPA: TetR/AcrR family transcriptional regulator [Caulobacterales bacterium]|nr:TetR/AcrR family transcriptional regulator [Caulobacterales bacterium]